MSLASGSFGWRAAIAGVGLFTLGACASDTVTEAPETLAPSLERPARVSSEIERGRHALASGDLPTAQAAFNAALRGSPNDPEPAIGLAETYLALGDLQTSEQLFNLVAEALPDSNNARLLQGRGLVALRQGKTDDAVRLLERSVELNPGQWRAWAGLGRAYGRQGRSRQARDAFARAEDAAPVPAVVINDLGMLHLEENDPAAALDAFERALAVDPANETASANARIARAMLGDYDAAVSGARPGELPDVLNNVGYIAIVNGDFDVADRLLRRAVEISPVYHEAATANLDLLAQAQKGVPLLALSDGGISTAQATTGTELSSVSGIATAQGEAALPAEMAESVAALEWEVPALTDHMESVAGTSAEDGGPPPAVAAVDPQPAPVALAHGFRWEAQPLSAKKRKRRRAAAPSSTVGGDPRTAAWPAINLPDAPPQAAAEPVPENGEPAAEPSDQTGTSDRPAEPSQESAPAPETVPARERPDDGLSVTLVDGAAQREAEEPRNPHATPPEEPAASVEASLPE